MQCVSRFEADMLALLYFFLRREPAEQVRALLEKGSTPPACLGRVAARLTEDALRKGVTQLLATRGGWRREQFLRKGRVVNGRLWERSPPAELGLRFSQSALEFLRWITAVKPDAQKPLAYPEALELSDGDQVLFLFVHEGLRQFNVKHLDWMSLPAFTQNGLCRLAYPDDFAERSGETVPDFVYWTNPARAWILEALHHDVAGRWVRIEWRKRHIQDPAVMRALGMEQERILDAFLIAVENAGRLDLARFLLMAAVRLLPDYADAQGWVGSLEHGSQRLADRAATYAGALAFLRQLPRLQQWNRRARAIGYFDDGYEGSQLWKSDWERHDGDALTERASAIMRQLNPLGQTQDR
jgi:hypothetical protein